MDTKMVKAYEYLEKLEALTVSLPKLEQIANGYGAFKEYPCDKGFAVAVNLFWSFELAVCKCWMAAGTVFPEHNHDEYEVITVVKGEGEVVVEGKAFEYSPCSTYQFLPKTSHRWEVETDTVMVCTTIPASPGFPDNGTN